MWRFSTLPVPPPFPSPSRGMPCSVKYNYVVAPTSRIIPHHLMRFTPRLFASPISNRAAHLEERELAHLDHATKERADYLHI